MRDGPVIDVEGVRVRLSRRFGPEVAGWCAALPALAGDLAVRWGLRLGQAWPKGGTSVVLPCESGNGEQLVLKLTPDLAIATDEATALGIWTGCRHVVRLHDADPDRGALLLERVLPGTRLADEPDPWPLTEVAPVLSQLWQEPPELDDGSGLPDLRERAEFVFGITRRRLDRHPEVAARVPPALMEGSQRRAAALAGEARSGCCTVTCTRGTSCGAGTGAGWWRLIPGRAWVIQPSTRSIGCWPTAAVNTQCGTVSTGWRPGGRAGPRPGLGMVPGDSRGHRGHLAHRPLGPGRRENAGHRPVSR